MIVQACKLTPIYLHFIKNNQLKIFFYLHQMSSLVFFKSVFFRHRKEDPGVQQFSSCYIMLDSRSCCFYNRNNLRTNPKNYNCPADHCRKFSLYVPKWDSGILGLLLDDCRRFQLGLLPLPIDHQWCNFAITIFNSFIVLLIISKDNYHEFDFSIT